MIEKDVEYWKAQLELLDWNITTESILKDQVSYDDSVLICDRYFIGISINREDKTGIIYHDRELCTESIVHELLHVKFKDDTEDQINLKCNKILELWE